MYKRLKIAWRESQFYLNVQKINTVFLFFFDNVFVNKTKTEKQFISQNRV